MFTYTLNAIIGKDDQDNFIYKSFTIEAQSWDDAQQQLNTLVLQEQSKSN